MGIYIKGMEMPTDIEPGLVIEFADGIDGKRYARLYHYRHGGLTEWLEAVPVPPHGRCIDADVLTETVNGIWDCNDLYFQPNDKICDPNDCKGCKWRETMDCFRRMVKHAPTIIEAEEGEA